jgi:hypothetical protein
MRRALCRALDVLFRGSIRSREPGPRKKDGYLDDWIFFLVTF